MSAYTQLFNERFDGVDANPIDPTKWTTATGLSPLQLQNHFMECGQNVYACAALYTAIPWPANQYIDTVVYHAEDKSDLEIVLRSDASEDNCYVFYVRSNGNRMADCAIESYVAGVEYELLDFGLIPFTPGDLFRFAVYEDKIWVLQNGLWLGSVKNSDHAAGSGGHFMASGPGLVPVTNLQVSRVAGGRVSATGVVVEN